ncbi:hypothetical protein ACFL6X_05945 [Candidatus Latescibacterota bacterium]
MPALLLVAGMVSAAVCPARADTELLAIGGGERPWEDWGTLDAIDWQSLPGWIQPRRTTADVNILHDMYANGQLYAGKSQPVGIGFRPGQDGRIWSINIPVAQNRTLFLLADGLQDTVAFDYFDRLASNAGVAIEVDLGIPFPVNEIAFYPLQFGSHVDLFVKGYELYANDGSPDRVDERGEPIYSLLSAVAANADMVVRNQAFSPQHVRYIKLRLTSPQAFELDQLEIRGEGFVRRAGFQSEIIDLGDLANLGRMLWGGSGGDRRHPADQEPGRHRPYHPDLPSDQRARRGGSPHRTDGRGEQAAVRPAAGTRQGLHPRGHRQLDPLVSAVRLLGRCGGQYGARSLCAVPS